MKTSLFKIVKIFWNIVFMGPNVLRGGSIFWYPPRNSFHKWRCFRVGGPWPTWPIADKTNYCNLSVAGLFTWCPLNAFFLFRNRRTIPFRHGSSFLCPLVGLIASALFSWVLSSEGRCKHMMSGDGMGAGKAWGKKRTQRNRDAFNNAVKILE